MMATPETEDAKRAPSKRSKRSAILDLAAFEFANTGYRASKWADVAEALGIGSTALYHYFASKEHCLFEIMADTLRDSRDNFEEVQHDHSDPRDVIAATIRYQFDSGELRIARARLMMAEMNLLAIPHDGSEREREAFQAARGYAHDIVRDWTRYVERCMREGSIPEQDPHLLARSLLGISSYVFIWWTPDSDVPLEEVRETTVAHALAIVFPSDASAAPSADRGAAKAAG